MLVREISAASAGGLVDVGLEPHATDGGRAASDQGHAENHGTCWSRLIRLTSDMLSRLTCLSIERMVTLIVIPLRNGWIISPLLAAAGISSTGPAWPNGCKVAETSLLAMCCIGNRMWVQPCHSERAGHFRGKGWQLRGRGTKGSADDAGLQPAASSSRRKNL